MLSVACVFAVPSCSTDHGLGPTVQGIRGTVHFSGTWPDSILEVRVAVFETYPVTSLLDLSGFSDPLPLLSDSGGYEVELPPGKYPFVAVVCRTTPEWGSTCILSFYPQQESPDLPQRVTVTSGEFIKGINMGVEFSAGLPRHSGFIGGPDTKPMGVPDEYYCQALDPCPAVHWMSGRGDQAEAIRGEAGTIVAISSWLGDRSRHRCQETI
jgi:hypothetical protein